MRSPILLTNIPPTAEEMARSLGMSPKRTKELMQLADELIAKHRNALGKRAGSAIPAKKRGRSRTAGGKSGVGK